jgi:uncharacterized membrane protein
MDATYIHLVLAHFPIVGIIIGIGILTYGLYTNNNMIKKVAFVIFIFMAILAIPVYLSGEEAEETVENIAGISEDLIEDHEELAEIIIWLIELLGVLSLVSLFAIVKKLSFAKKITIVTMIVSLVTFGFCAKVANLGGQIRHSEIRENNSNIQGQDHDGVVKPIKEEKDDDDD